MMPSQPLGEWVGAFVTVVDISKYFDSIDHDSIRERWEGLIKMPLPPDHLAIYKSITKYTTVDVLKIHERLELHRRGEGVSRKERRMRRLDKLRAARHAQLLSPDDFRKLVCGGDRSLPSLLQKNPFDYGIPQGTPISDVIANFYLLDFDTVIDAWVSERQGSYFRYSDDIIVIIPFVNGDDVMSGKNKLQDEISKHGRNLEIQDKKVSVSTFCSVGLVQKYTRHYGTASANGLEYLGFEYNGQCVKIKNATLSNAWRRLKRRSYGHARRYVKQYRLKGDVWLASNYPAAWIQQRIIRKVTIGQDDGFKSWTFTKYIRRAIRKFRDFDSKFSTQTKRYRRLSAKVVDSNFNKALERYGMQAMLRRGAKP